MSTRPAAFVAGSCSLALAILACTADPERPPATSSGGTSSASSGGGGSSSGTSGDGSALDGASSSSGGSSGSEGGTTIAPGLRALVDNGARDFADAPKALRQSAGNVVDVSGKDSFGNELRVLMTKTNGALAAGSYDCTGGSGATYGSISYTASGTTATWTASASGGCTITVQSIDNQVGGKIVGTFSGKAQRDASTEYLITNGQFNLTLE